MLLTRKRQFVFRKCLSRPWLVLARPDLLFTQGVATAAALRGAEEGPRRVAVGICPPVKRRPAVDLEALSRPPAVASPAAPGPLLCASSGSFAPERRPDTRSLRQHPGSRREMRASPKRRYRLHKKTAPRKLRHASTCWRKESRFPEAPKNDWNSSNRAMHGTPADRNHSRPDCVFPTIGASIFSVLSDSESQNTHESDTFTAGSDWGPCRVPCVALVVMAGLLSGTTPELHPHLHRHHAGPGYRHETVSRLKTGLGRNDAHSD